MLRNLPPRVIQIGLFLLTLLTTTLAGAEWIHGRSFLDSAANMGWNEFVLGFKFSLPFLLFLTFHEFGHYFMAKKWRVDVTPPYYIPLWLGFITSIGTMGAFIRIKERITNRTKYFDIGIAGPLAGFVVAVGLLWYGFSNLPSLDFLFYIHPEYKRFGAAYAEFVYPATAAESAIRLGDSLLFKFMRETFANPALLPHEFEITHYPFIFAGYLGLFFTSLNLIPIGQLDGGHILFGLIGEKAFNIVSPILFTIFISYAGLGLFTVEDFQITHGNEYLLLAGKFTLYLYFLYLCFSKVSDNYRTVIIFALSVALGQLIVSYFWPQLMGYSGFLAFGFLIGRVIGVYHPATPNPEPLSAGRQLLGWLALAIFILSFSPTPLY